jgi:hypothetical protein
MEKRLSDLEEILDGLYASEINASISWLWDGGIDLKLGDPLNGYKAEGKVGTFVEAAVWLRDPAHTHNPDTEFARANIAASSDARLVAVRGSTVEMIASLVVACGEPD